MLILHAAALDETLLLWGEGRAEPAAAVEASPRGARTPRRPRSRAPLSPYDAGRPALDAVLRDLKSPCPRENVQAPATASVWLPSRDGQPLPSSPLIAELPGGSSAAKAALAPWSVSVSPIAGQCLVDLLAACLDTHVLFPGVIVGPDLAFWAEALRAAGALVARERFVPGLIARDGKSFARWEPVLAGDDAARVRELASRMPDACRAMTMGDAGPAASMPITVLTTVIGRLVDALVRYAEPEGGVIAPRRRTPVPAAYASRHDAWLAALSSPDPEVHGTREELASLAMQIAEWRRRMAALERAPFRLCFRLEEPGRGVHEAAAQPHAPEQGAEAITSADGTWRLAYLLQAQDDPSLLVPAEQVWASTLERQGLARGADTRAILLQSLGVAASLNPDIEASLRVRKPSGCDLDNEGAFRFMSESGWALEQAGFGLILPAWWAGLGARPRLGLLAHAVPPRLKAKSGLSLDALVDVDWGVVLGDQALSLADLAALAAMKAPLIRVRGQWVVVTAEDRKRALEFLKKHTSRQVTARELVRLAVGLGLPDSDVPVERVSATGWLDEVLQQVRTHRTFEELSAPRGFQGTLRPYQARGYSWLAFLTRWGLGSCLADDMGLGKTIQTLALVQRNWEANERRPVLLVCPMSVVGNWQREAARFTPDLPVLVHHGQSRIRGEAFVRRASSHAIVVSSYALLHRDLETLARVPWAGVVLDEAQNIKNAETRQAQAARSLAADYRIALTGTPVENSVGDLWSLMQFLNPGLLGSLADFKRRFFVPIQARGDRKAAERLRRATGPFILRRLKTDRSVISDLPEKQEMKVFCTLTREQASLYAAVVADAERALDKSTGIERKGVVLATLSKLKQVCNHPAQFLRDRSTLAGRSGKLARLTEMIEEVLSGGDRALVFTQFAEMGAIVETHLEASFGRDVLFLHGGVPKKERDRMVDRFQSPDAGAPPVFVLSLKAGGTGLNLTAANHVFLFDRWWNPAVENQAIDRAFRIGQTRNVQVHKFLCVGTLEERIDEMIERKLRVAEGVVGSGEAWLTELSTKELKQLFALGREAVAE